uniref:Uncharacterized protein n=1 Tax=Clastoptera arizonana TaxID=38151 RepID=A0A1B6CJW0_9HEMI
MANREKKRSKLAFYKEKIIKEFDELGQELEAICREEMNIKNRARHLTIKNKQSLDVKQKKMEEAFLKSQKQDIITEAQLSIIDEVEEPNIWNVSTQNHPRNNSPTDTTPAQWSDQTDLQEILDRLEKRSKEMLEKLSFDQFQEYPGKLLNPSTSATSKTSSVKLVEKQVHVSPKDKSAQIQLTETSILTSNENFDKPNQIQEKLSTENLPKINVELNNSTIDLNVVGLDQTKKNTYTGSYDGVTVTVRLNKNSSKIKKDKSNLKYSGYETTSSAYCSPPDQIVPPKKPIIDDLIKTVGKINNLKPFIIKLLGMSRESVEEITRNNKEKSIIEEHSKIISDEDEFVHSNKIQDPYNQHPKIEHLKSLHDSLTEKYMEKLQQISQHYENLLSPQVSPAHFDHKPMTFGNISPIQTKPKDYFNQSLRDILDEMDHQTVVSTESSYNRLPADIENNDFPIHQEAVATQYKMYPKADQTFQELADLMVAQSHISGLFGLPQSISPKPPKKRF